MFKKELLDRKSIDSYLRFSYFGTGMSYFDPTSKGCDYVDFSIGKEKERDEYLKELNSILDDILTKERQYSEAAFLSSGVDSSLLACGIKAKDTFSVIYDDVEFDESPYARKTAEMIGSRHHEVKVGSADFFGVVSEALKSRELPTGDPSYIALYIGVMEAARITDTICSGEGPDEMFCGYHCYNKYLNNPMKDFYLFINSIFDVGTKEISGLSDYDGDGFLKMNAFDLTWWMNGNIIPNIDRAAAANNINIRTPYMRDDLKKFALSLPVKYKADKQYGKILFRESAKRYVGDEIASREKKGFPVPVRKWMRQEPYKTRILDAITDSDMKDIFSSIDLKSVIKGFYEDMDDTFYKRVYTLFAFATWYKQLV
ncbi:asparagine synthase-related protein [Butyrivibrio sp. WCE2006]|uniref:asparagine synthase-related protein n=1 Tax=Butyrivibrio sp. WCE2006 TaxID=1410611 RepID=UPI0005D1AB65|nr:asparagine synthase C-terminal domain-containing protein [Butyrivibrio sp. WCE2006]